MKDNFNRNTTLKEIKKELLKNGFVISGDRERDRAIDISKKGRPEIKEALDKYLDFI